MWIKLCWPRHQKRQTSSISYLSGGAQNTGDSTLRSSVEVGCCHGDFVIYIFILCNIHIYFKRVICSSTSHFCKCAMIRNDL